jgi:hypothetical protein
VECVHNSTKQQHQQGRYAIDHIWNKKKEGKQQWNAHSKKGVDILQVKKTRRYATERDKEQPEGKHSNN